MAEAETQHVQLLLRRSERLFIEILGHRKKHVCLTADRTALSTPSAFQRPQRNRPNVSDFGAWVNRRQRCPSDFERALYNAASPRIESFQKQRNMAPAKAEEAESFIRSDGNEQEYLSVCGFELIAKSAFDRFQDFD
jgi:hypothetical protein